MSTAQEAEVESEDGNSVVPLEGVDMRVLPVRKWKASAVRAMKDGNLDLWAEKSLADGDYAKWSAIDPDIDQCEAFFDAFNKVTGQSAGK